MSTFEAFENICANESLSKFVPLLLDIEVIYCVQVRNAG